MVLASFCQNGPGALVLGAGVGIAATGAGQSMGPEHALWITLGAVAVILAGVVVLTIWMGRKKAHNKK